MDEAAIDIAKAFARLSALTIFELRGEWRRFHRMPPPMRLSPRPLDPRDQLQASGAGVRRPLHGDRTEAGAGHRFAEPRRGQTHAVGLLEARHAARAGMARGHPHGPHPCRRYRVARSALPLPLRGRAGDHWRPLVGPAVLRPQAAAAGLLLKRESGPWPGLITREPG
jgi:hypothetical protein